MPNHVHAVIILSDPHAIQADAHEAILVGADLRSAPTKPTMTHKIECPKSSSLSEIVRGFKSFSTRQINFSRQTQAQPVWQRNYYDHIIRNEKEMAQITAYIESNPANRLTDEEYLMKAL